MLFNKVFQRMYNLPKSGIFILINEKRKYIYISYSRNLLNSVSRNIKEMQDKVHIYKPLNRNIKEWKFSIIETLYPEDSILDISYKINWYIQEYRNLGYDIQTHKNIVKLKFRVDVGEDFKIYCKLITKGYNEYVMGVFNNRIEAREFIEIYKQMDVIIPIYSSNKLTKEYIETL